MESFDEFFARFTEMTPEQQAQLLKEGARIHQQVQQVASHLDQLAQQVQTGTLSKAEAVPRLLNDEASTEMGALIFLALADETERMVYHDPQRSLGRFTLLYEIGKARNDIGFLACQCINLGTTSAFLGQPSKALIWFEQGVRYAEQVDDRQRIATAVAGMAQAHAAHGEAQRALEYYNRALPLAREVGDQNLEAIILGDLGNLYGSTSDREAIPYYEQALPLAIAVENWECVAGTLLNLGYTYLQLGDFSQAVDYSEQAVSLAQETDNRIAECSALGNLAAAYSGQRRHDEAIRCGKQGVVLARQLGNPDALANLLRNLASIYRASGNPMKAQQCLQEAFYASRRL